MGCTDSREETKRLDEEKKEIVQRNATSVLTYAFGLGIKDITEGRPYRIDEVQNLEMMQGLASNWTKLHERVNKKAIPILEEDDGEFHDTARGKSAESIDEEDVSQDEQSDAQDEQSDAPEDVEDPSEELELEEARPGLATVLGRRR